MSTYCTWIRKLVQNSPIWSSAENKLANLKTTSIFTSLSLNPSIYQSFRIRGAPSSNQQLVESKWGPKCVCCMLWNRIVQFGVQLVADLVCVWWCWRWWGRVWVYCKCLVSKTGKILFVHKGEFFWMVQKKQPNLNTTSDNNSHLKAILKLV